MGSPNSAKTLSKRATVKRNRLLYWATESQSKIDSLEKDLADHPGILAPNLLKLKEEIPERMALVPAKPIVNGGSDSLLCLVYVAADKARAAKKIVDQTEISDLPEDRQFFRSRILVEDTSLALYNENHEDMFPPELIKYYQGHLNELADRCVLAVWTSIFASINLQDVGGPIQVGIGQTYGKIIRVDQKDPNLFGFDQWMPATQTHNARAMAYLNYTVHPWLINPSSIKVGELQADWLNRTPPRFAERIYPR